MIDVIWLGPIITGSLFLGAWSALIGVWIADRAPRG